MALSICALSLLGALLFAAVPAEARVPKALVLSGGGLNVPYFVGVIDGVEAAGYKPDVILATCGSSIAATIAHILPEPADRKAFLLSEEFHELMLSAKLDLKEGDRLYQKAMEFLSRSYWQGLFPNIFEQTLLDVPQIPTVERMRVPFSARGPRLVILGGRLLRTRSELGKALPKGARLFQETLFTDADTARDLDGFVSPVSLLPGSRVQRQTRVKSDALISEAVRASISDPFLMVPGDVDGDKYTTGAIDLYPIEAARNVADEVAMSFAQGMSRGSQLIIGGLYGYSYTKRLQQVNDSYAGYWIDSTDVNDIFARSGLNPVAVINGKRLKHNLLRHPWDLDLHDNVRMEGGVPEDIEAFRKRVEALWQQGYERGLEGISTGTARYNNKNHVRRLNELNSSNELRKQLAR